MNDHWVKPDGTRWNDADRIRVSAMFRHHVDTPGNRRAGRSCRIARQPCHWHPDRPAEAHHLDYAKPFVVAWVCKNCHREIDHGALKVPRKAIWDYTSLIECISKPGLRAVESTSVGCTCGRRPRWMVRAEKHRPACPKNCPEPRGDDSGIPF